MRKINRLTNEELKKLNKELSENYGAEGTIAVASICIEGEDEEKNFYFALRNQNAYKSDAMLRSIGKIIKKYFKEVSKVYCMGKLVG